MSNETGVKVVIRIRPLSSKESEDPNKILVEQINDHVLVFDPAEDKCQLNGMPTTKFCRGNITRRRSKNLSFAFDHVFGPESLNVEVYEHTSKVILDGLLNGYNCSVFAYGATGAGKTYTMLGTNEFPGITFLTLMDLYQRIEALKAEKCCEVAVSYLEIYNEQIKDLLNSKSQLPMREDPKAGVVIPGLTLHKPQSEQDLLKMLYFGNQNRSQHPTDANAESSRSHAIFQVFVKQSDRTANLVKSVHMAKMCLVDLAGSERGTATSNRGPRMREGANINRSLLALGNVINALADGKTKSYIPYRDSKLTRLLKDSIGGNCRTVMITAVSPSYQSYEDTYNSLRYADRAKHIRADVKKNILNVKSNISKYGKIVENLRQEVQQLKDELKKFESLDVKANMVTLHNTEEEKRLQEVLYNLFTERKLLRKEILLQESEKRANRWRIYCKQSMLTQMEAGDKDDVDEHLFRKTKKDMDLFNRRVKNNDDSIANLSGKFIANETHLERIQSEMKMNGDEAITPLLAEKLRSHHLEVELTDYHTYIIHLKKIASFQEVESNTKDRLINNMQQTMTKLYNIVRQNNLLSDELRLDYNQTMRQRYGEKEVMWADETLLRDDTSADSISLETTLNLPILSRVVLTPMLDKNVRQRRASLTPILKKTKCFLDSRCKSFDNEKEQTPKLEKRQDLDLKRTAITNSKISAMDQSLKRPRSEESKPVQKTPEIKLLGNNNDKLKSPTGEPQRSIANEFKSPLGGPQRCIANELKSPLGGPQRCIANELKSPLGSPQRCIANEFKSPLGSPQRCIAYNGLISPDGDPLKYNANKELNSPGKTPQLSLLSNGLTSPSVDTQRCLVNNWFKSPKGDPQRCLVNEFKSPMGNPERIIVNNGLKSTGAEPQRCIVSSCFEDTSSGERVTLTNKTPKQPEDKKNSEEVSQPQNHFLGVDSLSPSLKLEKDSMKTSQSTNSTPSPLPQLLSPQNRLSSRDDGYLNLAGGATITKSKPTLPLRMFNENRLKPYPSSAAKENIKEMHRLGVSSMFDRKQSNVKKLQKNDSGLCKLRQISLLRPPVRSMGSNVTSSASKNIKSSPMKFSGSQKSLFRSKSVSDLPQSSKKQL
ncbi:kinesin-like protein KIF18A [Argonauta hians]